MVRLIFCVCFAMAVWQGCSALEAVVPFGSVNSSSIDDKIVGGGAAWIRRNPYQVALTTGGYFCGGSIISKDWVLTAAHCAQLSIDGMLIRAGSRYWNYGGSTRTVIEKIVHEDYNTPQELDNDVAVLKVSSPWVFGVKIKSIALQAYDVEVAVGVKAKTSGWGKRWNSGSITRTLRKVKLSTISTAACTAVYGSVITDSKLCASAYHKGVCSGDSGGPLVYNNVLIGVTSFTSSAGCALYPSGFAKVSELSSWIKWYTGI